MRVEPEPRDPPGWPGVVLELDGQDRSRYKELRFRAYLVEGGERGALRAQYYSTEGRKVQPGGALTGSLRRTQWRDFTWPSRRSGLW